ncbi:YaeP family protein [Enterovibrio calviensis]|uniref:YaeP family protein n=1 Tax=Enterovibrio calviensis TaxID=91359 RepID=UPI00373681E9
MKVYDCCDLIRQRYAEIGSGDQGYIPNAIACAVKTLNAIASDESVPEETREQAAFAAANLLISDHKDA